MRQLFVLFSVLVHAQAYAFNVWSDIHDSLLDPQGLVRLKDDYRYLAEHTQSDRAALLGKLQIFLEVTPIEGVTRTFQAIAAQAHFNKKTVEQALEIVAELPIGGKHRGDAIWIAGIVCEKIFTDRFEHFDEIRDRLQRIVLAYENYGLDCLEELKGNEAVRDRVAEGLLMLLNSKLISKDFQFDRLYSKQVSIRNILLLSEIFEVPPSQVVEKIETLASADGETLPQFVTCTRQGFGVREDFALRALAYFIVHGMQQDLPLSSSEILRKFRYSPIGAKFGLILSFLETSKTLPLTTNEAASFIESVEDERAKQTCAEEVAAPQRFPKASLAGRLFPFR